VKNIAVFVSGGGSNLQALLDACERGEIRGKIAAVISSKEGAYALTRAERHGVPGYVFAKKDYVGAEELYAEVLSLLQSLAIDLVVLAGYMSILPPAFTEAYRGRLLNVHPSLIPAFCGAGYYGLKVHEAVLRYGCKVTGATVHFVDEEADTGPVLLQRAVSVEPGDTPEILQARVLKAEHELLPLAVKLFCEDRIRIKGRLTEIV
jgi:phosphoribosylglycinamide formyltransferase-1